MQAGTPLPFSMPAPDTSGSGRPRQGLKEFPEDGGGFDALLPRSPDPLTGGGTPGDFARSTTPATGGPGQIQAAPGLDPATGGGTPADTGSMPATGGVGQISQGRLAPQTGGGGQYAQGVLAPETGGGTLSETAVPQPETGGGTPADTLESLTAQPATGSGGEVSTAALAPQTGGGTPADSATAQPSTGGGHPASVASLETAAPASMTDSGAQTALKPDGGKAASQPAGKQAAAPAQTAQPLAPATTTDGASPATAKTTPGQAAPAPSSQAQAAAASGSDAATLAATRPQGDPGLKELRQEGGKRAILDTTPGSNTPTAARANASGMTAQPGQPAPATQTSAQGQPQTLPQTSPEALDAPKPGPVQAPIQQAGSGVMTQGQADSAPDPVQGQDAVQRTSEAQSTVERPAHHGTAARMTPQSSVHLAAQIARRFAGGSRQFDIRMDPAELGRVDVRLQVGNDNRVQAILSAERPETLAELQRSARDLERALADAGLELGESGLQFQLSQGDADREFGTPGRGEFGVYAESDAQTAEPAPVQAARQLYGFMLNGRSGVDVRI